MRYVAKKLSEAKECWWWKKLTKSGDRQEMTRFLRYKSMTDLVFFCRVILGYDLIGDPWHYYLADRLAREWELLGMFGPRQTYKSVECNTGYSMQRILQDPNITIMQVGADEGVARGALEEIKGHFEENQMFRAVFGDWTSDKWSLDRLIVNKADQSGKDPTVGIGAPGMDRTSKHPKLIIVDDLEARGHKKSKVKRDRAKTYFKELFLLLRRDGQMLFMNTPWHHAGVCFDVMLNPKEAFYKHFQLVVMPIDHEGTFIMPSVYDRAEIEKLIDLTSEADVSCQYYLWPMGDGDRQFDLDLLEKNRFRNEPDPIRKVCILDPAGGDQVQHDYSAIVIMGLDHEKDVYVCDARQVRDTPWEICKLAVELARAHGCECISPEANNGLIAYGGLLKDYMKQAGGTVLPIRPVKPERRAKSGRIDNLKGLSEQGRLHIKESLRDFRQQLLTYPAGHDDMLDAAAYYRDVPKFRAPRKPKTFSDEQLEAQAKRDKDRRFVDEVMGVDKRRQRGKQMVGDLPIGW